MQKKAYLILEDGFTLEGYSFGYESDSLGEVVFNTSMSGYQEIMTDPSYNGQIMTFTYPMIGNYGINDEDNESSKVQVSGIIVKEYARKYSNYRASKSLKQFLVENEIPAIEDVDTRALTTYIRDKGALRGGIFFSPEGAVEKLKSHPSMNGLNLADKVTTEKTYSINSDNSEYDIAVVDYGVKSNILRLFNKYGFNVHVFPASTPFETLADSKFDGIFLSNGPGDPAAVTSGKTLVEKIVEAKIPCFGICLGHQIISLGLGAKTYKLKFGHRGGNQPVKNLETGSVEITSQNHGFAVDYESLKSNNNVEITHINLNDNTVEGLKHKSSPVFCVQYHPEAAPGPNDAQYLFPQFKELIKQHKL